MRIRAVPIVCLGAESTPAPRQQRRRRGADVAPTGIRGRQRHRLWRAVTRQPEPVRCAA
jgi:hypothetical protein